MNQQRALRTNDMHMDPKTHTLVESNIFSQPMTNLTGRSMNTKTS